MMKQYFLMLSRMNPDIEEALIRECTTVFRINYSVSVVYFFCIDNLKNNLRSFLVADSKEMVLMDITETEDFLIKMANEEENETLEELFQILKKENANNIDGVLDKITKYGASSLTKQDLKILKSL